MTAFNRAVHDNTVLSTEQDSRNWLCPKETKRERGGSGGEARTMLHD